MTIRKTPFANGAKVTPTPPPPPPPPPPVRLRTLKLNTSQNWLGNEAEENRRLDYAIRNGFNHVQLYGLYSVFNTPIESYLPAFIAKCYGATYNMQRVGAIMGAGTTGFTYVLNYNAGVSVGERFNDFNKENEFWNYPGNGQPETYANWIASLQWLYPQLNHATEFLSAYIQNYNTPVWGPTQASEMVAVCDVLECTNFTTVVNEPAVSNTQFQLLATAAAAIAKVQMVQPLWSAEQGFMGPLLGSSGMAICEADWSAQYLADTMPDKTSLDVIGFNYFDFNNLSAYVI